MPRLLEVIGYCFFFAVSVSYFFLLLIARFVIPDDKRDAEMERIYSDKHVAAIPHPETDQNMCGGTRLKLGTDPASTKTDPHLLNRGLVCATCPHYFLIGAVNMKVGERLVKCLFYVLIFISYQQVNKM